MSMLRLNLRIISIHAPPRGATLPEALVMYRGIISIHAPPRGATCIVHREGSGIVFQFTPLREGRLVSLMV